MSVQRVDYDKIDGVRWSRLKAFRTSALQYKHEQEHDRDDTPAMRFGRAVHLLVLEPHAFQATYAVYDGERRGKAWDVFRTAHTGREILTAAEYERAQRCAVAVRCHPKAAPHFVDGMAEQIITWDAPVSTPITGPRQVRCKARVDMRNGHLVELKTAADISPNRWPAVCARLGYFGQLAFYFDGVRASVGFDDDHGTPPAMIVVQNEAPYDVCVYTVSDEAISFGRDEYQRCLAKLVDCQTIKRWPGAYEDRERTLFPPAWAESDASDDAPLTIGGVPLSL